MAIDPVNLPQLPEGGPEDFALPCKNSKQLTRWKHIMEKVKVFAIFVFKGTVAIALFITNPSVFSVGFLIGIILEKRTHDAVNKIILIWRQQTWAMSTITGVAGFLSLPVTWAAGSLIYASYCGCTISKRARDSWAKKHPDQPFEFI